MLSQRLSWLARGMGEAQGKKVASDSVAFQTIEAQPVFGQIKPSQRPGASRAETQSWEKRWLISVVPYKGSERLGVEKETGCGKCRHRWRDRPSTETFLPRPMELDFRQPVEVLWKTIAFFRSGPEHPHADPIRTSSTTRVGRSLFACGGRENWERNVVDRPAPSDRSGLREDGQTRPCCAADEERPEASEDLPPRKRRHADLRHGENDMIASKCSRQSKQGRDDGPQDQRPGHGERDLSDRQRHAAGDDGN